MVLALLQIATGSRKLFNTCCHIIAYKKRSKKITKYMMQKSILRKSCLEAIFPRTG